MIARTDRKQLNTLPLKKATGPAVPEGKPQAAATGRMNADTSSVKAQQDVRDANGDYSRFKEDQGTTNGCGTTSLAALLSFWKGTPGAFTREGIDKDVRRANMFSSPSNLVKYARENGFRSEMHNNGSIEQLKQYTDKGVPVQVLFEPHLADDMGKDALLHYVTVTGFTKKDGKEYVQYQDPNDGPGTEPREIPVEDFKKQWGNLKVGAGPLSVSSGFNNLMLVHLPKENVPIKGPDGKVTMSNDIALPKHEGAGFGGFIADKIADVVNFGAKAVDTVKSVAKKVGKFLSKL